MTDAFMASPTIRERYGLAGNKSFDDTFSAVSLESILFYIVAAAMYVLESIFEQFKSDIDAKVESSIVASIPWYHQMCLNYQYGDELVFDPATQTFRYATIDPEKQVVKFAACRDRGGGVVIYVSGADGDGRPEKLSADVLTSFTSYLSKVKPAGIIVEAFSYAPDEIRAALTVQYDPMLLNPDGTLISQPDVRPVEEVINTYLQNIVYGGVVNKTRLVDAVQSATGVLDVSLNSMSARADGDVDFKVITGNNYTAAGGAFKAVDLTKNINYVLQL